MASRRRKVGEADRLEAREWNAKEIDVLHVGLVRVVSEHAEVAADAIVDQIGFAPGSWKKTSGGRVEMLLKSPSMWEVAIRRARDAVPVFRVNRMDNIWVSWFESWRVIDIGAFEIDGVSIALWCGERGFQYKDLLVRAEWDHFGRAHEGRAAQPHWHVDHPIGLRILQLDGESGAASGERLINDYHLGMRGEWEDDSKRGWHTRIDGSPASLQRWLRLCLEYILAQIRRYEAAT